MQVISLTGLSISINDDTQAYKISSAACSFSTDPAMPPYLVANGEKILFSAARNIEHTTYPSGLGRGILSKYSGFPGLDIEFHTLFFIEDATQDVLFTVIPVRDELLAIDEIAFPPPFMAEDKGAYAAVNFMQGLLLPADFPDEAPKLPFDGHMCSEAAYMPWFGEASPKCGTYVLISESPWDTKYALQHPAGGPTRLHFRHLPSLGAMRYPRTVRMMLLPEGSDYTDMCRAYRAYGDERGLFATLHEKAARLPSVDRLIGATVVHAGIKSHTVPASRYYDKEHPENNDSLLTFAHREAQMRSLKAAGLQKAYLHLDGWGQPGYDNQHPDYMPPCAEAGGWEGLKSLSDAMGEMDYLFGIHDQYRDYYFDAPTFNLRDACRTPKGNVPELTVWAGGRQAYLCATLAPAYVKRNFTALLEGGVRLQAAYLDVFTCNEPDECTVPDHVMSRKDCLEYRGKCFDYLLSQGILPSSEEVADWSNKNLVFCHWAPYAAYGIPVPLFNLALHDTVVIPWMLKTDSWGIPSGTDGFLHALLNGGIGYVDPELTGDDLHRAIARAQIAAALHDRVGKTKMTGHAFLSADKAKQRAEYQDGTVVTVDFGENTWEITPPLATTCKID